MLALLNLLFRDWRKSGLLTSILMLFFSVYGLLYSFLKNPLILNGTLGHHRLLAGILVLLLGALGWFIFKKIRHLAEITLIANLFAFYLVVMPLVQLTFFSYQQSRAVISPARQEIKSAAITEEGKVLPDIYYIILDSYDRSDYLASEYKLDNSEFLDLLRDAGFYIADCSRSNYAHTFLSLSSTLNMSYVQDSYTSGTLTEDSLKDALVHSQFRNNLEQKGYTIVSFDNVHWDFSDADKFYAFKIKPILNPYLFPIESAFIDNSALRIFKDLSPRFLRGVSSLAASSVKDHYFQQQYLLDSLDESISLASPKFVFAHIEKPHGPYVFEPNGDFIQEDAFYRDKYFAAVNQAYDRLGYVKQVEYLNRRMVTFINRLIQDKQGNAIIIIQGDHGIQENEDLNGRMAILNAVYLPGRDYSSFYPSVTPINTFRIISDQFFSGKLGLLKDQSYYSYREDKLEYFPVEETMPGCVEK